jgi:trimethylamine--corrinoid protein Co-methyltransferase
MSQNIVAFPHLSMLTHDQCQAIHRASLEILRHTGVRVYHDGALELLRETDAVITDENASAGSAGALVHLPAGLVEWALKQAPSRAVLCKRGSGEVAAPLEGRTANFGPGSDCPTTSIPAAASRVSSPPPTWWIAFMSATPCRRWPS